MSNRWSVFAVVGLMALIGWFAEPMFHPSAPPEPQPFVVSHLAKEPGVAPTPRHRPIIVSNGVEMENSGHVSWSHGADGSSRNAEGHWEKHGGEFSQYHSARDYERGANNFASHPPPGTEVKHRSNGDTELYNPDSNTCAVVDDKGEPRTMFKPHNGKKYWAHQ
jgi:hypothetical protein